MMISEIQQVIDNIIIDGGEFIIGTRDAKHSESVRVTAFNVRRRMPEILAGCVGIQKGVERNRNFVKIYRREFNELEHLVRDPVTGELVPVVDTPEETDLELKKIIRLKKKDGESQAEIDAYVKDYIAQHNPDK